MRYMLDTNICIYAIKNRPASVLTALRAHEPAGIGISSISVAELYFGAEKSSSSRNLLALQHFLEPLEIADFDMAAAQAYGGLRHLLEKNGTPIGPLDTQIAAHALALGVSLVTNNTREFARVPGLRLENWVETP
ncbi:MAG: type II toxin-antitoxin system VapC family toxin [Thiobacillus sp.]|nr:type II toxin-antitoxin system VapC family toxin [Thiobacillus sp.]MDP2252741.1 type II toxin-antitoxin system VapC family toxin [Thiobacillus sp.]MDP2978777.1 type II toxin-antitoxin system VapC family toxin [Thiobacillus sp.]